MSYFSWCQIDFYIASRETERDWDKDLAEDVKGECEAKYGPVTAIKVEKETQVSFRRGLHFEQVLHDIRERFMLSSILSNPQRKPLKVSMDAGSEDDKSRPHSYPMPLCRPTNDSIFAVRS